MKKILAPITIGVIFMSACSGTEVLPEETNDAHHLDKYRESVEYFPDADEDIWNEGVDFAIENEDTLEGICKVVYFEGVKGTSFSEWYGETGNYDTIEPLYETICYEEYQSDLSYDEISEWANS